MPRRNSLLVLGILAAAVAAAPTRSNAQEGTTGGAESAQELAKKLANPVSDLVSIPIQFNWENGVGTDEGLRHVLNIQPVVPFTLNPKLNLIGRWILPYVAQPASLGASAGFSDVVFSTFFSPSGNPSLTWGAGPVFSLPMTSDPTLGSGQWSAGPTAVVLRIQGPWVYGLLANHLWSFAEASNLGRSDVNQTFLQPFLAHSTESGVTYTLQSESVANWNADGDDTWTVPVNLQVSKLTKLGPFPFSVLGGVGVFVASPDGGPEWKLRTAFILLLPRE